MIFKNQASITSTPHTYHNEVIFVPVEQIMHPDSQSTFQFFWQGGFFGTQGWTLVNNVKANCSILNAPNCRKPM
jgi:hypothetical protein